MDSQSQFGDEDVFASGPVVAALAATFEQYWDSRLAIPAQALLTARRAAAAELARRRTLPQKPPAPASTIGRLAAGEGDARAERGELRQQVLRPSDERDAAAAERVGGLRLRRWREIVATRTARVARLRPVGGSCGPTSPPSAVPSPCAARRSPARRAMPTVRVERG